MLFAACLPTASCILFLGVDDPEFTASGDTGEDASTPDGDAVPGDSSTIELDSSDTPPADSPVDARPDGPTCPPDSALCSRGDSCCVPGGRFLRTYDGVTSGLTNPKFEATVSDFRLDKYEVTVARFRPFVAAVVGGFRPAEGSGKHTHLNSGAGLNGGTESGWLSVWNSNVPADTASWDAALMCPGATWTSAIGATDTLPINCVNWYEAYAFCIWDGAFLPAEAEWNYAAAGGSEQRKFPWGSTDPGPDTALAIYDCRYKKAGACSVAPVGSAPGGTGKWGHADLAGNVWEWTLDILKRPYADATCNDCAFLAGPATDMRTSRGGAFISPRVELYAGFRSEDFPDARFGYTGIRCARAP